MDSYGLLPSVRFTSELTSEKHMHIKLIWTLMGSYGLLSILTNKKKNLSFPRNTGIYNSFGLLWALMDYYGMTANAWA